MWRYAAAATQGLSHLRTGSPCQDRHAVHLDERGLIIAVSDGAGSAPMSGAGAETAVTEAIAYLKAHLEEVGADWAGLAGQAAQAARTSIHAQAIEAERSPRDYACTLLLLVLVEGGGAVAQIGDGVVAYRDNEAWAYVFWPQKGEYANTTRFLTEEDAEDHLQVTALRDRFLDVAVMTDGLENIALHFGTQSVHEPFFEALLPALRRSAAPGEATRVSTALTDFLRSERITSRADDDLTLVLASRAEQ